MKQQVDTKFKLLATTLVLAALFSAVVLWRVDRFVYGDRLAWAEAQARSQVSSLVQAVRVEVQAARRMLNSLSADTFRRDRTNWNAFQPYYGLALMTSQQGSLAITQLVTKDKSPAAAWTTVELAKYIGFMGKELETPGLTILRSFQDPKKNRHVAVIFTGGNRAYVLIGSGSNFQTLIDSQKGSINSFTFVASDGLTISHPVIDYVGTVMSNDVIMKEIRNTGAAHGLGTYLQAKKNAVFAMYEKVPHTNLYVISSAAMDEILKGRMSLAWQFVFLAIGFTLVGAALYFWWEKQQQQGLPGAAPSTPGAAYRPNSSMLTPAPQPLPTPAATPTVTPSAPVAPPPPPAAPVMTVAPPSVPPPPAPAVSAAMPAVLSAPSTPQEKNEAYRQVAAAMGNEMRGPMASILGFSQMVLAKTQDPEVVNAVESILREARNSRDVLEKLYTFSGERNSEKQEMKLDGPIIQALKNLEAEISRKGVKVEKNLQTTTPWLISSNDLTKAFENIFTNAIEAMERMTDKTLTISLSETGDGLDLKIVDSGEGIEAGNLGKVFDPFFTTRSFAHHVGLGLPVVAGILKEHQAQIQIQSERGKGTTVLIHFDKPVAKPSATPQAVLGVATDVLKAPPPRIEAPVRVEELPQELPKVANLNEQEEQIKKDIESKPMDVNIDHLLELPQADSAEEEMKLEFLPEVDASTQTPTPKPLKPPPPTAPSPAPVAAAPTPPPFQAVEEELNEPKPNVAALPTAAPQAIAPSTPPPQEVIAAPPANLTIDAPNAAMSVQKTSVLDSYKVAIRRPGKRN